MRKPKPTAHQTFNDNLTSAVAAMQVEMRKSSEQIENLILMMNARTAADSNGSSTPVIEVGRESNEDGEPLVAIDGKTIGTVDSLRDFLDTASGSIAPTEDELVGAWMADQREAGATTVDLKQVDDIRTGMRYALNGG